MCGSDKPLVNQRLPLAARLSCIRSTGSQKEELAFHKLGTHGKLRLLQTCNKVSENFQGFLSYGAPRGNSRSYSARGFTDHLAHHLPRFSLQPSNSHQSSTGQMPGFHLAVWKWIENHHVRDYLKEHQSSSVRQSGGYTIVLVGGNLHHCWWLPSPRLPSLR